MNTLFKAVKDLIIKEPFYGLFLLGLNKRFDDKIKTAAVTLDGINPVLLVNREFWYGLDDTYKAGILKHEAGHILMQHLTSNWGYLRRDDPKLLNIAMDMEINCNLPELKKIGACFPDQFGLEDSKGTLYYYEQLYNKHKGKLSKELDSIDNHELWGDLSDAEKELVKQQIDNLAKSTAEQVQKNCGNIPGQFKDYIDSLFKIKQRIFDWKKYFRRYIGTAIDVQLKKTRKKESVRFPDASGIKHKRKSSILVVVDTSGSIMYSDLCDFFSEIHHIYQAGADIEIIENDTCIQRRYKYAGKWDLQTFGRICRIIK